MVVGIDPLLHIVTLHWSLHNSNLPDNEGQIIMITRRNTPENTLVEKHKSSDLVNSAHWNQIATHTSNVWIPWDYNVKRAIWFQNALLANYELLCMPTEVFFSVISVCYNGHIFLIVWSIWNALGFCQCFYIKVRIHAHNHGRGHDIIFLRLQKVGS